MFLFFLFAEMETKLDARQAQFPATFPDTFKDFFAMMSEDEDHMDLFSNLLEDKVNMPEIYKSKGDFKLKQVKKFKWKSFIIYIKYQV